MEIEKICERWLLKKEQYASFPTLTELYETGKHISFTPLIRAFTERLEKIPYKFSKSEQVSGSICFYGGVFTSLLNTGCIDEIEGLFTFALCYMLIDHFLDNSNISEREKKEAMTQIYNFLSGQQYIENDMIAVARDRYFSLIEHKPLAKEYILKLLNAELRGSHISKRKDLPREYYLNVAKEKGCLLYTSDAADE